METDRKRERIHKKETGAAAGKQETEEGRKTKRKPSLKDSRDPKHKEVQRHVQ